MHGQQSIKKKKLNGFTHIRICNRKKKQKVKTQTAEEGMWIRTDENDYTVTYSVSSRA